VRWWRADEACENPSVRAFLADFRDEPLIQRWATIGVGVGFVLGGIGGLIRGLEVYAATAWFAAFEIGVPAAIVG
jgi:hypothetical protein